MPFVQQGPEPSPKNRPHKAAPVRQVVELQALLMDDARDPELTGSARAQVARAWVDLQEMRLRLQMRPAPKPVDVSKDYSPRGRKRSRAATGVAASDPVALPTPTPAPEALGNS